MDKGDYVIQCQLRYKDDNILEKFKDILLLSIQKLSSPISLDIYQDSKGALFKDGKKVTKLTLNPEQKKTVYLAPLPTDK